MDVSMFYGRKENDLGVRAIPSDREDSELESDGDSGDSEEEWIPTSGLRHC